MKQIKTIKMLREDIRRENELSGYIDLEDASEELYRKMEKDIFDKGNIDTFSNYFELLQVDYGIIDASTAEELLFRYDNYKKRLNWEMNQGDITNEEI